MEGNSTGPRTAWTMTRHDSSRPCRGRARTGECTRTGAGPWSRRHRAGPRPGPGPRPCSPIAAMVMRVSSTRPRERPQTRSLSGPGTSAGSRPGQSRSWRPITYWFTSENRCLSSSSRFSARSCSNTSCPGTRRSVCAVRGPPADHAQICAFSPREQAHGHELGRGPCP